MIGKRTLPVHIPIGLGFTSIRIAWLKGHPSNSTLILKVLLFKMFALGIKSGRLTSGSDTSLEIFSMLRSNTEAPHKFLTRHCPSEGEEACSAKTQPMLPEEENKTTLSWILSTSSLLQDHRDGRRKYVSSTGFRDREIEIRLNFMGRLQSCLPSWHDLRCVMDLFIPKGL